LAKKFNKIALDVALNFASRKLRNGIGKSKREVYKQNGGYSPYIHSWSTFNRYMGIAKDFVKKCFEHNIKRLHEIDKEFVRDYILEKTSYCSQKTIKINMSALEKFFDALNRPDLANYLRENYQSFYEKGRIPDYTVGFAEPDKVIEKLGEKNLIYKDIATLQYQTGARIGDIKKIKIDEKDKKVIIERSKGGKSRILDYSDRIDKFNLIKESYERFKSYLEEHKWSELRKDYEKAVRDTANSLGERYTGAHAFRVNYAIERYQELKEKYGRTVADKELTKELGHERVSMSRYYAAK